jgi:hypothetical protein
MGETKNEFIGLEEKYFGICRFKTVTKGDRMYLTSCGVHGSMELAQECVQ